MRSPLRQDEIGLSPEKKRRRLLVVDSQLPSGSCSDRSSTPNTVKERKEIENE